MTHLDGWAHSRDAELIKSLLQRHQQYTGSVWAARLYEDFDHFAYYFRVVTPKQERVPAPTVAPIKLVR